MKPQLFRRYQKLLGAPLFGDVFMANKTQSAKEWLRESETGQKITKSSSFGSSGKTQTAKEWLVV